MTWIPRLVGQKVVLNVDGLDWKRKKWGPLARSYLRAAERWATRFPHAVVTDSRRVQRYYRERYGAEPATVPAGSYIERVGLEPGRYVLFVGRLVPENCAHHLVEAFEGLSTDFRCVIIRRHYSWESVTDAYEQLFRRLLGRTRAQDEA